MLSRSAPLVQPQYIMLGVTLWRSDAGYELFIPRGFALCLWEGFTASAMQFGLEIL